MATQTTDQQKALHKLAAEFAPTMWLHEKEEFSPMQVEDFLSGSALWKREGDADEQCIYSTGQLPQHWYEEDTSPSSAVCPASIDEPAESGGYQLWLVHKDERPGKAKLEGAVSVPVYYFVRNCNSGHLITYWFFFGYSQFMYLPRPFTNIAHQGDWEQMSVFVRKDNDKTTIDRAWFHAHSVDTVKSRNQLTFADGKLQGFFSRNRHGTYWKAGKFNVVGATSDYGSSVGLRQRRLGSELNRVAWEDDVSKPKYRWNTEKCLAPLLKQGWREYSGAWGKLGRKEYLSGPAGPWRDKRTKLDSKVC